jgi:AbrB family looped-hinge helix DNA binding protein
MTSKGRITIPADVRARFGLRGGVKIEFLVNEAGDLVMRQRTRDIRTLRNAAAYSGPPISVEDMDEATAEAVVEVFRS